MEEKYNIKTTKYEYGCFKAIYKCKECDKILLIKEISWEKDKLGTCDKEGIENLIYKLLATNGVSYCCGCGSKLFKEE